MVYEALGILENFIFKLRLNLFVFNILIFSTIYQIHYNFCYHMFSLIYFSFANLITFETKFGFSQVPFLTSSINKSFTNMINPFSFDFNRIPIVPVKLNPSCFEYFLPIISSIITKSAFSSLARINTSASPSSKSRK